MEKRESLAELICRTVLEFEKRQAALQQESNLKNHGVVKQTSTIKSTSSPEKY